MKITSVLELILTLLEGVAAALNKEGLGEIAHGVEVALASLESVRGSLVTKAQVDSFKITPSW